MGNRIRTRFVSAEAIRRRLGEAWPSIFDDAALEAFRLEVEGMPWGVAEDATIALAGEHAGIGARRLRAIIDPTMQTTVLHEALSRGRVRLDEHRRAARAEG